MNIYLKKKLIFVPIYLLAALFGLLDQKSNSEDLLKNKNFDYEAYTQLSNKENFDNDNYILGSGDLLSIKHANAHQLNAEHLVGPNGRIYFERLGEVLVEGLTSNELKFVLEKKYSSFLLDPSVGIKIIEYRPVKIFIQGEVQSGGFYTISEPSNRIVPELPAIEVNEGNQTENIFSQRVSTSRRQFPTLFSALKKANGITENADLSNINIIRRSSFSSGNELMQASVSLLSLLKEGDESQNIRLYDGDIIKVNKSETTIKNQLLKAAQINLNPKFINVFISGRINSPGTVRLPQGSSLNQAISIAGGAKVLKGKIEFIRFNNDGLVDRRLISYRPKNSLGSKNNPTLADGDIIRIKNSALSAGLEVFNEVTAPFIGVYSIINIFSNN